jgi:hypothetical protein
VGSLHEVVEVPDNIDQIRLHVDQVVETVDEFAV